MEAKIVTYKPIFIMSYNYLHIRKNPLLDNVFGNFRSPVNLEAEKTSYTLINSDSLQLLIHTKGAYQKSDQKSRPFVLKTIE